MTTLFIKLGTKSCFLTHVCSCLYRNKNHLLQHGVECWCGWCAGLTLDLEDSYCSVLFGDLGGRWFGDWKSKLQKGNIYKRIPIVGKKKLPHSDLKTYALVCHPSVWCVINDLRSAINWSNNKRMYNYFFIF